ncbi:hypothetical protein XELAEV_18020097mg [Xenopus laevis]|uniref:Uncharacterized protein n=1 Tax=Xenopus laevis TaxID=8355 RepID=A0A974D6I4_XENLA|nr:hypothetical protein XELAEV_18020097mg [Xenopus laevis]
MASFCVTSDISDCTNPSSPRVVKMVVLGFLSLSLTARSRPLTSWCFMIPQKLLFYLPPNCTGKQNETQSIRPISAHIGKTGVSVALNNP